MKRSLSLLLGLVCCSAAAADAYVPGGENDPQVRLAQYLAGNGRYLDAAATLMALQAQAPQQHLGNAYYSGLAADALSFGMPQRAEVIYREQIARATDPLSLNQARLRLADFFYQRGYYQKAGSELHAMRAQLPKPLQVPWQDLQSRVLLAQGRYGEAVDVLNQGDNGDSQTPFMRYNLGVALINDGRVGQGVNILDRVGRMVPDDEEGLALRDKANLTLGYHYLEARQGGTAIPIFDRIRQVGPYSNRALLGLGWAHLAPRGKQQEKAEVGDEMADKTAFTSFATIGVLLRPGYIDDSIYKRARLSPFHLSGRSSGEEAQLKQALVFWTELVGRDPMDPAVQEGMLAIPYVLDRLGAHIQAQQYYEQVIPQLEETRQRLDQAIHNVSSGLMINTMIKSDSGAETGWTWKLRDLPDAPETFYLKNLIAENRFQEALKNYRDVRLLESNLTGWKKHLTDLQQGYQSRHLQDLPPAPPVLRPAAATARDNGSPAQYLPDNAPPLQMAERLSPYSDSNGADSGDDGAPVNLQLAQNPGAQQFVGVYERMQAIIGRIDALMPQLEEAEKTQRALLENVALDDLQKQKELNEKYLVESRFALARIYDSQLKGQPESPSPGPSKGQSQSQGDSK